MKKTFLFLAVLLLAGFGCTPATVSETSDFKPVEGKASAPAGKDASLEGPFERRVMTAISYDGLAYTENGTWIADQANVPDAVVKDGNIYLYYSGWIVGDRLNTTAVAISEDQEQTWTYKYVELENAGPIDRVVDPDIVLLEDGTFRLFFTAGNPQGIHYAEGADGITFAYKGSIFAQTDDIAIDSTTMKIGDTWHMYALSGEGVNRLWHLTSTDGLSFTVYDLISFPNEGVPSMPSNGIWIDDRFYLFMFAADGMIGSMWSKNGFDWYPSEEIHLEPAEDEQYVKDPTVIQLDNGQYLMFYVTNIP
ncbi:MAG TPA: hypothetical protein VJB64_03415 [Patescibacteria group bacterium]|nr:hypothetical protein [Patescibacteria group bacterium]